MSNKLGMVVRWLARILSILIFFFILVFFFGEFKMSEVSNLKTSEIFGFIFMAAIILGNLLGIKKEFAGGVLSISGLLGFYLNEVIVTHNTSLSAIFFLMALPGILFVILSVIKLMYMKSFS